MDSSSVHALRVFGSGFVIADLFCGNVQLVWAYRAGVRHVYRCQCLVPVSATSNKEESHTARMHGFFFFFFLFL